MAVSQGTIALLEEQLAGLGTVRVRRMFGGGGVYAGGVMFGLVAGDVLYFKGDEATSAPYDAEGMGPFIYEGRSGAVKMPYWRVPERLLDEPDELIQWARAALDVAQRTAAPKAKRKTKGRRSRM
jgi:DNA transformation protein